MAFGPCSCHCRLVLIVAGITSVAGQHLSARPRSTAGETVRSPVPGPVWSGVDRSLLVAAGNLDAAWFGFLGDRDGKSEHSVVVAGLDPVGVEIVAKEQLATEHSAWPLRRYHLPILIQPGPFCTHSQHVALDVEIQRVFGHARQVELDDEFLTLAPSGHWH